MTASFEAFIKHLREKTGLVEVDLPPSHTSADLAAASRLARERRNAINRGDRVAHLYKLVDGVRTTTDDRANVEMLVSADQVEKLLALGARWVGPEEYRPKVTTAETTRLVEHLQLYDFKAHRDTRLALERFTLLVGDNASGKSSVLDALLMLAHMSPRAGFARTWPPGDILRRGAEGNVVLRASGRHRTLQWRLNADLHPAESNDAREYWDVTLTGGIGDATFVEDKGTDPKSWRDVIASTIGRARLYKFRADSIASASYSSDPNTTVRSDGSNTAVVLAALKLGNDELFELIEEALRRLVPAVERIRIRPASVGAGTPEGEVLGSKLYFDFRGAPGVPAHGASHGTLIVLSLLTVLYGPHRPNLILLDDFDHALHPRAQKELVRLLLSLQRLPEFADLQILATTHSPYVLDEVETSSVYAFALRSDGTSASKRLSEHPDATRMGGSITPGQLWTLDSEKSWVLGDT